MSATQQPAVFKPKKWLLLFFAVAITASSIVLYSVYANRSREAESPILGTWQNEAGGIINFRADGTGRGRSKVDPRIRLIDWSIDESNQLVFYERTTRNGLATWVEAVDRMRGVAQPARSLIEFSDDRFILSDVFQNPATGEEETSTIVFTRCEDPTLEAAR